MSNSPPLSLSGSHRPPRERSKQKANAGEASRSIDKYNGRGGSARARAMGNLLNQQPKLDADRIGNREHLEQMLSGHEPAVSIQNNRGPCGTIFDEKLHRHRLQLVNKNEPYKCNGCCEDGNGERYQCPQCDNNPRGINDYCPPQYHSFCGEKEKNFNHTAFPRRCFSLKQIHKSECVNQPNLYCVACSKDIEGFHYYSRSPGNNLYLHPWCMHLEEQHQVNHINVRLRKTTRNKCIHCGLRRLARNRINSNGQNETQRMDTWSYETQDGSLSIHICCMKEAFNKFWQSRITEEDLTAMFNKGPAGDNMRDLARDFGLALLRWVSRTVFGLMVSAAI